jgi:putative transposase
MTNYRRLYVKGAMWFLTVNLAQRQINTLLVDEIDLLRTSVAKFHVLDALSCFLK